MKKRCAIGNWKLTYIENKRLRESGITPVCRDSLDALGCEWIDAAVPGNFELDLMKAGKIEDVYYGKNALDTQKLENRHLFYSTSFAYERAVGSVASLVFEGVDTAAYIYLDGELLGFVENMLHPHRFTLDGVEEGRHELFVHILPAAIYSRGFHIPSMCYGLRYNHDGIAIRKPGYMFGWDIMPRIVSAGLWRGVYIEYLPKNRIENPYTYTEWVKITDEGAKAKIVTTLKIESDEDFISDFTVVIEGKCGSKSFKRVYNPLCASMKIETIVDDAELWWPKNYGEQKLYDLTVTLLLGGEAVDSVNYRLGIRHLWLKRSSLAGDEGDFSFYVNGKRIFINGSNWVPPDAFPSRHDEYTLRGLELADDLGCNMLRCWGGNAYPSDVFYNYCDEKGILVWQDFSLACGHYPSDDRLAALMAREVYEVVTALRQHPSLALWAGDNECDVFVVPYGCDEREENEPPAYLDPNKNRLTREVIARVVRDEDALRPYIPSSPYLDEVAWLVGNPAENHIWGPRDFFKGDYYRNPACHFASEIGYHGCPSPDSVKRFIPEESLPRESIYEICENGDWLVHAAGMVDTVEDNPYAYRLPLMISHVKRIFGTVPKDLSDFARLSQISQAEAKKYFIEHFRIRKATKSGILWWNVIDGWPQISDAIVDWYGVKKLAYHYIKRSQAPFVMMIDEPDSEGELTLVGTNESREKITVSYTVTDLNTDGLLCEGELTLEPDGYATVGRLPEIKGGFYLISWEGSVSGVNHYVPAIGDTVPPEKYLRMMEKAGFAEEFEGFDGN